MNLYPKFSAKAEIIVGILAVAITAALTLIIF